MTLDQLAIEFNQKIMQVEPRPLGLMDPSEMAFSATSMREEVQEMLDAYDLGDLVGVVDAMTDLDFFLRGIRYKHGITEELYEKIFQVVFDCNMKKTLGQPKPTRSELALDAIKPITWVGPEDKIRELLEQHMDAGQ